MTHVLATPSPAKSGATDSSLIDLPGIDRYDNGKPCIGTDPQSLYAFGHLIRLAEQLILDQFSRGLISGTTHTCIGEELTAMAVVRAMDPASMQANALTSTFLERARVPLALPSDRQAIEAAVSTCNHPDLQTLRLGRIRNTLHLEELYVSESLLNALSKPVDVLEGPLEWPFDDRGNLDLS